MLSIDFQSGTGQAAAAAIATEVAPTKALTQMAGRLDTGVSTGGVFLPTLARLRAVFPAPGRDDTPGNSLTTSPHSSPDTKDSR